MPPVAGGDYTSRHVRLFMWFAHHLLAQWLALGPAAVAAALGPAVWVSAAGTVVFAGTLLLQLTAVAWHDAHHLCPRCADHLVVDGAWRAAHRVRTLTAAHRLATRRLAGWLLAVTVVLSLAWPGHGLPLLVLVLLLARDYCQHVHAPLRPWCPQCHRYGGPPDDHPLPAPVPPPVPAGQRPTTA